MSRAALPVTGHVPAGPGRCGHSCSPGAGAVCSPAALVVVATEGARLLEFHGTSTDTAAARHTTHRGRRPKPVDGIRASAGAATAAKREAVRCGECAMIRTARVFTARGVLIAAISHAPKRRVSRSITGAGPPGGSRFW
jgi:hypothetical protein